LQQLPFRRAFAEVISAGAKWRVKPGSSKTILGAARREAV
jgi:hypothetical protein